MRGFAIYNNMAFNFNISIGNNKLPNNVERQADGSWWYGFKDLFGGSSVNKFESEESKLNAVLYNPAILKVISYRADIYSQVKFNLFSNDNEKEKDFLYSYKKQPNPYQSWTDFHWDVSFWRDLGNAYIYMQNDVWYCLNPCGIELSKEQKKSFTSLAFSDATKKKALTGKFKYKNGDTEQILELSNLHVLTDLSNSVSGNWLGGNSRLDSLYQVAKNSELSLTAKNKNLFFTTKFMVSGEHDSNNISSRPMGDAEQNSISNSLKGTKDIFATPSKVTVNQLVSNLSSLKLDESYLADLAVIANMYGMDKDILSISAKGSTYENKEKSIGSFIDYSMMPKVVQHSDLYENVLGLEDIRGSFKHLPFNSIFEAEKIANKKIEIETLKIASELGMDVTEQLKRIYDGY